MRLLVTRAQLARIVGVSRPSITLAARRIFPGAVVGDRVDLSHPAVQEYLSRHDGAVIRAEQAALLTPSARTPVSSIAPDPARADVAAAPSSDGSETTADDIARHAHWSLEALVRKFGTATRFGDWLDAWKRIGEARDKHLRYEERLARLISKEFVQQHVFAYLAAGQTRLLQDAVPTLVRRIYSEARAERPVEESVQLARELVGQVLAQMKSEASRALLSPTKSNEAA